MVDNEILKEKLRDKLNELSLTDEEKNIVVIELNKLSQIFINAYLRKNENIRK